MDLYFYMKKTHLSYAQKFEQVDKEAIYTLCAAVFVTAVFWLCIFIFKDDTQSFMFNMPLWFVLSCIGGYLLSVVTVIVLVKFFFKNFALDTDDE